MNEVAFLRELQRALAQSQSSSDPFALIVARLGAAADDGVLIDAARRMPRRDAVERISRPHRWCRIHRLLPGCFAWRGQRRAPGACTRYSLSPT